MSQIAQNIVVIALVIGCVAYLIRGAFRTLALKSNGLGKCCSKGCEPTKQSDSETKSQTRVTFMPKEFLTISRATPCVGEKGAYSPSLADPETAQRNDIRATR